MAIFSPAADPTNPAEALFAGFGGVPARCRAVDSAATPLGPVEGWPAALHAGAALFARIPIEARGAATGGARDEHRDQRARR